MNPEDVDIEALVNDREAFNAFVYTPLEEALAKLEKRAGDKELGGKIEIILEKDIPEILVKGKKKAVLFRQIATPNYEIRRFIHILDAIDSLEPLFGEYSDDVFFSINEQKKYWGKIMYFESPDIFQNHTKIIDFKICEGKKISEIKTLKGQLLVDFHHGLFEKTSVPVSQDAFYNISVWLHRHGKKAKNYYRPVLAWFIQHAMLFENFVLKDPKELTFIKNIFLPAFINVYKETGCKPLIINLLPTDIEDRKFWFCHPKNTEKHAKEA